MAHSRQQHLCTLQTQAMGVRMPQQVFRAPRQGIEMVPSQQSRKGTSLRGGSRRWPWRPGRLRIRQLRRHRLQLQPRQPQLRWPAWAAQAGSWPTEAELLRWACWCGTIQGCDWPRRLPTGQGHLVSMLATQGCQRQGRQHTLRLFGTAAPRSATLCSTLLRGDGLGRCMPVAAGL